MPARVRTITVVVALTTGAIVVLSGCAGANDMTYAEVPDGAEPTYTTDAPELIDALHAWFDRQVTDHGAHATSG